MIIIGIDVGYHNMAMVETLVNEDYDVTVTNVYIIDLKNLPHRRVSVRNCCLNHSNEIVDLMAHFIQEYGSILDNADKVLIERQPPTGLTQIETLLFYLYRNKTTLVSPNAMHSHFKIGHLEYNDRKQQTILIANPYLKDYPNLGRIHDASDALCLILFHVWPYKERKRLLKIDRTLPFDNYKYVSSV